MSNFISPFLCPNYEDYEPLPIGSRYLKHYPEMWDEEKYAEGALWRERQEIMRTRPSFFTDYIRWWKNHIPKDWQARTKQRSKLAFALATLAEDSGWQVKNAEDVARRGVSVIYETTKPKPKDEGVQVDLREAMTQAIKEEPQPQFKTRSELQAYALATLAKEQGYAKKGAGKDRIYFTFIYKVRTMKQKDLKLIEVTAKYLDAALEEERKKLIDKACEWLFEWLPKYVGFDTGVNLEDKDRDFFIREFRKAMEG